MITSSRIAGIISAVSSLLVIYVIMRSSRSSSSLPTKTYHRIMFGMSLANIIASIAAAFSYSQMLQNEDDENPIWLEETFSCNARATSMYFGMV